MTRRQPYVGGNWKMNLDRRAAVELVRAVAQDARELDGVNITLFPSFVHLDAAAATLALAKSHVALGAQNCSPEPNGALTGEVSIDMLKDQGVTDILVGHSERRRRIGESDELIRLKTIAVLEAGLTCVLCIGETLAEREAGETDRVNDSQLRSAIGDRDGRDAHPTGQFDGRLTDAAKLIIAYEPVWAIGTGRTATPNDAQLAHSAIRATLTDTFGASIASTIHIIYGGSVKPENAAELFSQPDIDGGLIGGASLVADDFLAICNAASRTSRLEGASRT